MKKLSLHAVILLLCFVSVALWEQTSYTEYSIPLIGILTILYLFSSKVRKRNPNDATDTHELPTIVLLLTCVLLLLGMTGGIYSLLFFLLYFLPFYLATLLEPRIVFFFALYVSLFFFPDIQRLNAEALVKITALLLFTPVAFFLGKSIQEKKQMQVNESKKGKKIMADVSEIIKTQGQNLDNLTISKLKDIVDTSKSLGKEKND